MEPNKSFSQSAYFRYSSLAFQMGVTIGLFAFVGYKLDQHYHLNPGWCTIGLSLVGVVIALYIAIKDFIKPQK